MARKTGNFNLKCQVLDYPALDLFTDAFKKPQLEEAISPEIAEMFNLCYRKDEESKLSFASPVFASKQELEGLPPALIITAQLDSLKDEAKMYADMLKQAGVIAEYHNYENVSHGFTISAFSPLGKTVNDNTQNAANDVLDKTTKFLRKYLF